MVMELLFYQNLRQILYLNEEKNVYGHLFEKYIYLSNLK